MRPEEVRAALSDIALVRRIYAFDELASTSDWAKQLISRAHGSQDLHGTLVIANHQTAGRGRFDRRWHAPPGKALLLSMVLAMRGTVEPHLDTNGIDIKQLAVAVPVAVAQAITSVTGLSPRIKFPNDVLLNSRKVCGVLLESVSVQQRAFAVLGIGVNVNQAQEELPVDARITPTSLALETGREIPPDVLLCAIARCVEELILHPADALSKMNLLCETLGAHVSVDTAAGTLEGVACGVTSDGALILRNAVGVEHVIHSGDIMQVSPS